MNITDTCKPGTTECLGKRLQFCKLNGEWTVIQCPGDSFCGLTNGKYNCIEDQAEDSIHRTDRSKFGIDDIATISKHRPRISENVLVKDNPLGNVPNNSFSHKRHIKNIPKMPPKTNPTRNPTRNKIVDIRLILPESADIENMEMAALDDRLGEKPLVNNKTNSKIATNSKKSVNKHTDHDQEKISKPSLLTRIKDRIKDFFGLTGISNRSNDNGSKSNLGKPNDDTSSKEGFNAKVQNFQSFLQNLIPDLLKYQLSLHENGDSLVEKQDYGGISEKETGNENEEAMLKVAGELIAELLAENPELSSKQIQSPEEPIIINENESVLNDEKKNPKAKSQSNTGGKGEKVKQKKGKTKNDKKDPQKGGMKKKSSDKKQKPKQTDKLKKSKKANKGKSGEIKSKGKKKQPQAQKHEKKPLKALNLGKKKPPADSKAKQPPADSKAKQPPADSKAKQPPADSKAKQPMTQNKEDQSMKEKEKGSPQAPGGVKDGDTAGEQAKAGKPSEKIKPESGKNDDSKQDNNTEETGKEGDEKKEDEKGQAQTEQEGGDEKGPEMDEAKEEIENEKQKEESENNNTEEEDMPENQAPNADEPTMTDENADKKDVGEENENKEEQKQNPEEKQQDASGDSQTEKSKEDKQIPNPDQKETPENNKPEQKPNSEKPLEKQDEKQDEKQEGQENKKGKGVEKIKTESVGNSIESSGFTTPPYLKEHGEEFTKALNDSFESKEEQAMFLSQIYHESGGLNHMEELQCVDDPAKCAGQYDDGTGAPGKSYHGRGFMQLSWPQNYKDAGQDLGYGDKLYENPELVSEDPQLALETSIWYWNKHVKDSPGVKEGNFGATTKAINGKLECSGGVNEKAEKRYEIYNNVADSLGVEEKANESGCY